MKTRFFTLLALGACALSAVAQDMPEFSDDYLTYEQTFNELPNGSETDLFVPWINNENLPGWYAFTAPGTPPAPTAAVELRMTNIKTSWKEDSTAIGATAGITSFGYNFEGERALGSRISNAIGDVYYGVKIVNNCTKPISSLTVTFTGEQWSVANKFPQPLMFSYKVNAETLVDEEGWEWVEELTFTSPSVTDTGAKTRNINGNDSENRVEGITHTFNVDVPVGGTVWLRWYDLNERDQAGTPTAGGGGVDNCLAIDDLLVEASLSTGISDATIETVVMYPSNDLLIAKSASAIQEISIITTQGVSVIKQMVNATNAQISVGNLPSGVYLAVAKTIEGKVITKLFVK